MTQRALPRGFSRLYDGAGRGTSNAATVSLHRAGEADPAEVGAKAANLRRAAADGLPVLPGFVITTTTVASLSLGWRHAPRATTEAIARAWTELSDAGRSPVVVRSSSAVEDQATSSLAGLFVSIVDVGDWASFVSAVGSVARSARRATTSGIAPTMAVLVQAHLEPRLSGVLFGLDPLSGRTDRLVVAAVEGGPQQLVSGAVDGTRYLLRRRGGTVEVDGAPVPLSRRDRRSLAGLARRASTLFGGPQDIEWAVAQDGRLWLFQSRPVTAAATPPDPHAPLLGPGPLAETFPDPLGPLEEDLWVPPLRQAMVESIRLTGGASRRRLASSPVVVTVGGRAAVDLALLGADPMPPSLWSRLDPRPPLRRLGSAWTVGRLRAALPALAADVAAEVDAELASVPALGTLPDDLLVRLLDRAGDALRSVHGYEMLTGLLPAPSVTAASHALAALAGGRRDGMDDPHLVAARPVVLALTPPSITESSRLPAAIPAVPARALPALDSRETLRLRVRWLHELTVRVALELGRRLAERGILEGPGDVGLLTGTELRAAVGGDAVPSRIDDRRLRLSPPLPASFRLVDDRVVAVTVVGGGLMPGRGASPGRAAGAAYQGPLPAPYGSVLVVAVLDPDLAPYLAGLAGLVAETGSPLSHLAILARELGVPSVVGCVGALDRFPPGTPIALDGNTGVVTIVDGAR